MIQFFSNRMDVSGLLDIQAQSHGRSSLIKSLALSSTPIESKMTPDSSPSFLSIHTDSIMD